MEIAQTGQTHDPYFSAVFRARAINSFLGGAFVLPWEVQDFPDEWMDVIEGLVSGLPDIQSGQAQVEAHKTAFLKGYR